MSLDCPGCGDAGDLRVIETRSTATRIFRTRRCKACGVAVVTCEGILPDGFIPRAIRKPAACEAQAPVQPAALFGGPRLTPFGTREFWGTLLDGVTLRADTPLYTSPQPAYNNPATSAERAKLKSALTEVFGWDEAPQLAQAPLTDAQVQAGLKALFQCADSDLDSMGSKLLAGWEDDCRRVFRAMIAAAPQPTTKPMTQIEINAMINNFPAHCRDIEDLIVRAVERHHGIGKV